ncbi:hypothetical protein HNY73_004249 [Argiope bruennichi]|uniref:THAP-type domain-containing protein n=2 Tax=Argiope bruennichi TaxID=94029 RepID=A0A8T0FSL4_ARGBR|nr:hypothetical protein HNY73_004249 [Argiope bruennichi]
MFHFPKDPLRRRRWELATRRANWKASNKSRLCSKHFITGKPSKDPKHPDYVPSIFVFNKNIQNSKSSSQSTKLKVHGKINNSEAGTCPSCGMKTFCTNCCSTESMSSTINMSLEPLNQTLTQLMDKLKDMEEEREQLCNELASCREEIHQLREAHQHCIIQSHSSSRHSKSNSFGSIPSTSDDASEILESIYSDESTDVFDQDSSSSLSRELNYHQSYEPSKDKWRKKHSEETHSDEVIGIIEQCSSSRKKRVKGSNLESNDTSNSLKSEKSTNSGSPITIVYLKR